MSSDRLRTFTWAQTILIALIHVQIILAFPDWREDKGTRYGSRPHKDQSAYVEHRDPPGASASAKYSEVADTAMDKPGRVTGEKHRPESGVKAKKVGVAVEDKKLLDLRAEENLESDRAVQEETKSTKATSDKSTSTGKSTSSKDKMSSNEESTKDLKGASSKPSSNNDSTTTPGVDGKKNKMDSSKEKKGGGGSKEKKTTAAGMDDYDTLLKSLFGKQASKEKVDGKDGKKKEEKDGKKKEEKDGKKKDEKDGKKKEEKINEKEKKKDELKEKLKSKSGKPPATNVGGDMQATGAGEKAAGGDKAVDNLLSIVGKPGLGKASVGVQGQMGFEHGLGKRDQGSQDEELKSGDLVHELLASVRQKLKKEGKAAEESGLAGAVAAGAAAANNTVKTGNKGSSNPAQDCLPTSYRLKNIRSLVSPELLYALAKAGDGDTFVLAANGFPSARLAQDTDMSGKNKLIRQDGMAIVTILAEIMKLLKISSSAQFPLLLMKPDDSAKGAKDPKIWAKYKDIIESADKQKYQWAKLSKLKFYEEAKKAFAIIQTGDENPAASMIITKGKITSVLSDKSSSIVKEASKGTKAPPASAAGTTPTPTPTANPLGTSTLVDIHNLLSTSSKKAADLLPPTPNKVQSELEAFKEKLRQLQKNNGDQRQPGATGLSEEKKKQMMEALLKKGTK